MDETTIKALIGLIGIIGGALIGGFVAAYNASQKLKELQITHSHQLHENYLKNAREYTESVYAPLSIAITSLSLAYMKFRKTNSTESEENPERNNFRSEINVFINTVDNLLARGASAFLTTELENTLLSFRSFVEESLSANEPTSKVIVSYGINFLGINQEITKPIRLTGKRAEFWQGKFGFSQFGVSMRFKGQQILAAPLNTELFEEKFVDESVMLKLLVKEVTLGSHARN